jgi:hypothetical protein
MIIVIGPLRLTVVQGGVQMSNQSPAIAPPMSSVQVWAHLTADHRARAIRLMAQLAFNLVVAQPNSPIKECDHVIPTQHSQNPN